jgi:hypothetical protein
MDVTRKFVPSVHYLARTGDWEACVRVQDADRGLYQIVWRCDTRWGARLKANRRAKRMTKAHKRGELII